MAFADGITIDDPKITIDGISFKATARSAMLAVEDDKVDISNFINPKGARPGASDWTAEIELELTYGPPETVATPPANAGTWNTLHAMRKLKKTIVIAPSSGVASVSNPTATFSAYIPSIPFIMGEVAASEAQRFTLVLNPIGDPVITTA